jgi:hypothetical protein
MKLFQYKIFVYLYLFSVMIGSNRVEKNNNNKSINIFQFFFTTITELNNNDIQELYIETVS